MDAGFSGSFFVWNNAYDCKSDGLPEFVRASALCCLQFFDGF